MPTKQEIVSVRVLEQRVLLLDEGSYGPGARLDLPAADAQALEDQGIVEPVTAKRDS